MIGTEYYISSYVTKMDSMKLLLICYTYCMKYFDKWKYRALLVQVITLSSRNINYVFCN